MTIPDGVSFDELNKLYSEENDNNLRSMPFAQFFGEMDLSDEQIRKRMKTAEEVQRFMLVALMELYYSIREGAYGAVDVTQTIRESYRQMIEKYGVAFTSYFEQTHPDSVAADIVMATLNHPDDAYFFSEDRARLIAENEANSVWNDAEFQDAILTGKRRKTWMAIRDKRTRDTHKEVDGTTIPIGDPFQVGDSLMMFPLDASLGAGPEEIVNCRCSVSFS